MRYVYLFALMVLSCVPAQAALTYADSGQWTFHADAVVSDTLIATSMVYGAQLWGTGSYQMTDDYYVGEGLEGYGVALLDGLLCLSTTTGGLLLLDCSDPADITLSASVSGLGSYPRLLLRDESGTPWLYSASRQGASSILRTRDVTAQPGTAHGTLTLYDDAVGLAASGTTVFVATDAGVEAITVSNHDALVRADSLVYTGSAYVRGISVANGICALALSSQGVRLIDVSTPSAMTVLTDIAADNAGTWTDQLIYGVALSTTADSLLVVGENIGMTVWDISTPGSASLIGYDPRLDSGYPIAANAYKGVWHGDKGYGVLWGHYRAGVNVADLTSANVDSLARTAGYDYCRDVIVSPGGAVYSAVGDQGIIRLGSGGLALASTWGVAVSGTTGYAAGVDAGGFSSVDFSTPGAPSLLDNLATQCRDVVVREDVAYVAAYTSGLLTVDISTPASLAQLDLEEHGTSTAYGVDLALDYCATADGADGLNIWDVSNPAAVTHLGNYNPTESAVDVALSLGGEVAYVALTGAGVAVVDLETKASPALVTTFGPTGVTGVSLVNGVLCVSAGSSGVYCYAQGPHPLAPVLLDSYDTAGDALRVEAAVVDGRYTVYVADWSGLVALVLDIDAEAYCD